MSGGTQRPGASLSGSDGQPHSEYSIDPEKAQVFVRFARKLTPRDIAAYVTALKQEPPVNPNLSEIVDLRAVEDLEITPAQAIALAEAVDPLTLSAWRAVVIGNDFQANSPRMHQMVRSPAKNIAIFDSLAKAEEWVRSAHPQPSLTKPARVLRFPSHSARSPIVRPTPTPCTRIFFHCTEAGPRLSLPLQIAFEEVRC